MTLLLVFGCEGLQPTPEAMITLDSEQQTDISIPSDGETFDVCFTSALDWTAEIVYVSGGDGWASMNLTSGKGGYSIARLKVNVQKNSESESRSAKVVITSETKKATVSFTQEGHKGLLPGPDKDLVFRLTEKSAEVPAEGGTVKVTVEYNVDYECKVAVDWIREVESRSYDQKVHVFEVLPNENEASRNTTISFCGNGTCIPFHIEQAGSPPEQEDPVFKLSSQSAEIEAEGGMAEVTVTTNVEYSYEVPVDWIKEVTTKAADEYVHTFEVMPNENSEERSAVISFICNGESIDFIVNQEGAAPEPDEPVFELSALAAEIEWDGGIAQVTVTSNVDYTFEIPVSWIKEVITKAVNSYTYTFEVMPNDSNDERRAGILFCGNDVCIPFVITQKGRAADARFEVDVESISVEASGTDSPISVNVSSNMAWSVSSDADWCSVSPTSGVNDGSFNVTISKNTLTSPRIANITVSSEKGLYHEISVIQSPTASEPEDDSWRNEEFIRRSLVMRFTADWCGNCPSMASVLYDVQKELPDKIEVLSVHESGSGLASGASRLLTDHYDIYAWPTGLIDCRTRLKNERPSTMIMNIKNAIENIEDTYDTVTGASWNSSVKGNKVNLDLSLYIKESGTYKVTALLVEDGIVGFQEDYTNGSSDNYEHNGVVRDSFTEATGDIFTVSGEWEKKNLSYSMTIPDGYVRNNLKIVVYIQRKDQDSYYVDNTASAWLGQTKKLVVKSGTWGEGNEGIVPGDDIIL